MSEFVGQILQEVYQVERLLGTEELGKVWLAQGLRQRSGARFAVLQLKERLTPFDERYRRVLSGLNRVRMLRGSAFWPIEPILAPDGTPCFVSEIAQRHERLRHYLAKGPLKVSRALRLALTLSRSLARAHEQDLLHGDLRPETILLTPGGLATGGRGILLLWHSLYPLRSALDVDSPAARVCYRPRWQLVGSGAPPDATTDVFAIGAVLYECLTGRAPFYGDEIEYVLEKLTGPPSRLSVHLETGLNAGLIEQIDPLLQRCCAPEPGVAPTANELAAALEEVLASDALEEDEAFTRRVERGMTMLGWADDPSQPAQAPKSQPATADAGEVAEGAPTQEIDELELVEEEPPLHDKVTVLHWEEGQPLSARPTYIRGRTER